MKEEEYKELNKYLNEVFKYLEENYEPLLINLNNFNILNDKFLQMLDKFDLNKDDKENNLTYEDVFLISREIIKSINPKYLKDFDNLIKIGELDFSYENEYIDSHFYHDSFHNEININRYFNYGDIRVLIHEYFHYVNGRSKNTKTWNLLTEFFSIYFEMYAIDYLIKSGVSKKEIDYKARLRWSYNISVDFSNYEIPLLAYYESGSIDKNSYKIILGNFMTEEYTEELFNKECKYLLEYFRKKEKKYKLEHFESDYNEYDIVEEYCSSFSSFFKYVIGTIFALYARNNCKIEDIIYMNDHINDDIAYFECLHKMGIYVNDDDFDDKLFESIEKNISDYQIKKR